MRVRQIPAWLRLKRPGRPSAARPTNEGSERLNQTFQLGDLFAN